MLYNLESTAAFQMKVRENNISIGKKAQIIKSYSVNTKTML